MAKYSNSNGSLFLNVYIDQGEQNIAANTTSVNWEMTVSRSSYYHTYNNNGSSTLSLSLDGRNVHSSNPNWEVWDGEATLAKGSSTIAHNADGSKILPLSCTFNPNNGYHESITVTANISLTTIPRASSVSVNAGIIGSPITINISRHSSTFKHTVRYVWGNKSGTIASNVDSSATWTIPLDFANEIPNSTIGTGTIYVDTYNGTSKIGTQQTSFTASIPNDLKPTLTGLNLVDLNGVTRELLNGNNFLQVVSDVQVNFLGATGSYGSTIKGYRAEIVNKKMVNGSVPIRASVFDSRGKQSDTKDTTINVIEYYAPSLSFSAVRTRENPNIIQVIRNAKVAPIMHDGRQKNIMSLSFRVAKLGKDNFTTDNGSASGIFTSVHTLINSAANMAGNYLANSSFIVIGRVEDKITNTEFSCIVTTESVVGSYDKNGRLGVGKVVELGKPGSLDVLGDIYSNNKPIQQYQLTSNNGRLSKGSAQWDDIWNKQATEFGWRSGKYDDNPTGKNGDWGLYQNFWLDGWKGVQFFTGISSNRFFFRTYNSSNKWAPTQWKEIVTKDDLQKIATRKIELGWFINGNVTRNGNLVTISTERKITDIATISDYREIKETIPAGFRPTQEVDLVLQGISDSNVTGTAILHLDSDGKIRLTSKSQGDKYWTGTITYVTSDPYP